MSGGLKGIRVRNPLTGSAGNMLGLMHSALDLNDTRVHSFTQWLNNDEFVDTPRKGKDVTPMPRFSLE